MVTGEHDWRTPTSEFDIVGWFDTHRAGARQPAGRD